MTGSERCTRSLLENKTDFPLDAAGSLPRATVCHGSTIVPTGIDYLVRHLPKSLGHQRAALGAMQIIKLTQLSFFTSCHAARAATPVTETEDSSSVRQVLTWQLFLSKTRPIVLACFQAIAATTGSQPPSTLLSDYVGSNVTVRCASLLATARLTQVASNLRANLLTLTASPKGLQRWRYQLSIVRRFASKPSKARVTSA
jgi:hypothetical protein